jgi:uncharacterized repeat protein (TIGR02543 family)
MKKRSFILVVFLLLIGMFFLAACQGEVGIAGEKGATGLPGDKGPKGETGDKGAKGAKGETGEPGEDADNVVLGVSSEGIVWKNESDDDESYEPVISWDDLFAYRYTYTITLDPGKGTCDTKQLTGLIYKEDALVEAEPTYEPYSFAGWYTEDDELVNGFIKVEKNITLHAEYYAEVVLDGVDGASGAPRAVYKNEAGEQLPLAEIVANVKKAFIDAYCVEKEYDDTKKAEIMAMTTEQLFGEFKANLTKAGGPLYDADLKTTDFCDEWVWLFDWVLNHPSKTSAGVIRVDAGRDPRSAYVRGLVAGNSDGSRDSEMKSSADYPARVFANAMANFFNMDDYNMTDCSVDKQISFKVDVVIGEETYNPYLENGGLGGDEFPALVDILPVTLEPNITLAVGETYELIPLTKAGFVFAGWKDENGNDVTSVDGTYNGKIITAQWTPAA